MIGRKNLHVTAERANFPLGALHVRQGSAANVALFDVPERAGISISRVWVRLCSCDGVWGSYDAVKTGSLWVVDIPAAAFATPGDVPNGVEVWAAGFGADGETSASWSIGVGDLCVLDGDSAAPVPGDSWATIRVREAEPEAPVRCDAYFDAGTLYVYDGSAWIGVGAAALAKKMDKLPTPCPANFFPITKTDGTLQRSSYTPASFAQSWHEHYSSSIMHYNAATGGYDSLDYVLDDLVARVKALEAAAGNDVGVTLGTVHHNGMSATAYPGTVGGGDYSSWLTPTDCMTCLMVRADRVLEPACGDFSMGGDLKSDFYGAAAGVEYEDPYTCTTARFVLPLYDVATCYGNASTIGDKTDFDYWRAGSPSSGVRGRLVQDAEGTWWLCCTPRIQCFCESPMPTTYGDDDPYAIAAAIKSTYSSSCFDFDAQMRAFLKYADCGCDEGEVVADGYTTVAISEYPAI